MNILKILSALAVIVLVLSACSGGEVPTSVAEPTSAPVIPTSAPEQPTATRETPTSAPTPTAVPGIGTIDRVQTNVKAGPENNLQDIVAKQDLHNSDAVKVTDGGIAQLEFPNQISLKLFNDTSVGGVSADVSGTANARVRMKLERGGLSGHVDTSSGGASFEIANGATIKILGTQFFIVFDEKTGIAYAGNFDGSVEYTLPNGTTEALPAGKQIDILPDNSVTLNDLPFTRSEFEQVAQSDSSALQARIDLRLKYADLTPNSVIKYVSGNTLDLTTCKGIKFAANVTDPEGVKSVKVQFHVGNFDPVPSDFYSPDAELELTNQGGDLWSGLFNDTISQYQEVTYWQFVATDNNGSETAQHIYGTYSYYAANFGCP